MRNLLTPRNRKGQINNLVPSILALVFAAVLLVLGLIMIQSLNDADTLKNSASVTNETNAWLNETTYNLDAEDGSKTDTFSLTAIWAAEGGEYNVSVPLANATVVSSNGAVTNATTVTHSNVSYSYSYQAGEEAWDSGNKTISGLGTFADFWEIIVLAIITTVVIGLLLAVFGNNRKRR